MSRPGIGVKIAALMSYRFQGHRTYVEYPGQPVLVNHMQAVFSPPSGPFRGGFSHVSLTYSK
jgi:hypothetical protein